MLKKDQRSSCTITQPCAGEQNNRERSQPTLQTMCRADATCRPAALPDGKRTTCRMCQTNKTRNQCFNCGTYTCGTCAETVCPDCLKSVTKMNR